MIAGPDVGVDDGRARALVLADLGQDLRRAGHVDAVADGLADDLLDAPLVRVVGVGVEQRDRDRLDVVLADLLRDVANGLLVELRPASRRAGRCRSVTSYRSRRGTSGCGLSYWMS